MSEGKARSPRRKQGSGDRAGHQDDSALRLLGSVMIGQNDEWIVLRRYFSRDSLDKLLPPAEAAMILSPVLLIMGSPVHQATWSTNRLHRQS